MVAAERGASVRVVGGEDGTCTTVLPGSGEISSPAALAQETSLEINWGTPGRSDA